jgi:hypothetical protein
VGFTREYADLLKQKANLEIIGFDLGHGETAICRTMLSSTAEPEIIDIEGKPSIITAVSMVNGEIAIGEKAYLSRNSQDLSILFKDYRFDNLEVCNSIQNFVKGCLKILRDENKIKGDQNSYFFVGSPSGWNEEQRNKYEELLKQAGMTNVKVRPESRAAFLDAKESGVLSQSFDSLSNLVIIIDIGSSTTDFTIVKDYQEKPLDFGNNKLGGSILDELIFEKVLNSCSDERTKHIQDIFRTKPDLEKKCKLKCREVKEKYFSKSNEDDWTENPAEGSLKLEGGIHFDIEICKSDVEEILDKKVLQLGHKNWKTAFREELIKCRLSQKYLPKLILMTGGGSRMRFTQSICKEVFEDIEIRVGLEPHLTIAKGLARLGRTDFKIQAFRSDVDNFIRSPNLVIMLKSELPKLFESLSSTVIDQSISIAHRSFEQWLNGEISTLSVMEEQVKLDTNNFFKSEGNALFRKDVATWLEHISSRIEMMTYEICDKYAVPRTVFNLNMGSPIYLTPEQMSPTRKVIDLISSIAEIGTVLVGSLILPIFLIPLIAFAIGATGYSLLFAPQYIDILKKYIFKIGNPSLFKNEFLFWYKNRIDSVVKDYKLPKGIRRYLLSEQDLKNSVEQQRSEFEKFIKSEFEKQFSDEDLVNQIFLPIKDTLYKKADEVALLIK